MTGNGVRKRFPRIRCAVDEGRFYSPPAQRQAISQKLFDTSDALNQTATDAAKAARAGKSGLGRFAVDNGMPLGKDVLQSGLDAIVPGLGKTLRAIDLAGGATRDYRYSAGDDYDPDKALARGAFTGGGVALGELAKWGVGRNAPEGLYSSALRRALDAGAYAGGETLGGELGHAWTEAGYETDWGRVGRSGLDAAAFAALDDLIGSAVTSWQNKAQIKSDLEDVKQQYEAALRAFSDPHATPEEQAELARRTIDMAKWVQYELDNFGLTDTSDEMRTLRRSIGDRIDELKPIAGSAQYDPFRLVFRADPDELRELYVGEIPENGSGTESMMRSLIGLDEAGGWGWTDGAEGGTLYAQDVYSLVPEPTQAEMRFRAAEYRDAPENKGVIAGRVADGQYSLDYKHQKYLQHCEGTPQYENATNGRETPQSFLTISEPKAHAIVYRYCGKGTAKITKSGDVLGIEFITTDSVVGKYWEKGAWHETKRVQIIYSKDGVHIVPVMER